MFCKICGKEIGDEAVFCPSCGAAQQNIISQPVETSYQRKEATTTNTMAVIGFVVAMISLLINFWGLVGIAATVLSVLGYMGCQQKNQKGKGLAMAGIIIGAISVVFGAITLITLAM